MYTAYIHVFFSDIGVTKFKRDQLFGWQDIVGIKFELKCIFLKTLFIVM